MTLKVTKIKDDRNKTGWVLMKVESGHKVHAKVYDEASEDYGINDGRVSKLQIDDDMGKVVFNYDRGHDVNDIDPDFLESVIAHLETLPQVFA